MRGSFRHVWVVTYSGRGRKDTCKQGRLKKPDSRRERERERAFAMGPRVGLWLVRNSVAEGGKCKGVEREVIVR